MSILSSSAISDGLCSGFLLLKPLGCLLLSFDAVSGQSRRSRPGASGNQGSFPLSGRNGTLSCTADLQQGPGECWKLLSVTLQLALRL